MDDTIRLNLQLNFNLISALIRECDDERECWMKVVCTALNERCLRLDRNRNENFIPDAVGCFLLRSWVSMDGISSASLRLISK